MKKQIKVSEKTRKELHLDEYEAGLAKANAGLNERVKKMQVDTEAFGWKSTKRVLALAAKADFYTRLLTILLKKLGIKIKERKKEELS